MSGHLYLWTKTTHLVMAWMVSLFYLPRVTVHLAHHEHVHYKINE
ncbi:MAG: hypothetical protein CMI17_09480 [Opitutaceae bacterium]|nr:hypothetical protein [Opitutaceae bacterium]